MKEPSFCGSPFLTFKLTEERRIENKKKKEARTL
jgi:hypothetical protein